MEKRVIPNMDLTHKPSAVRKRALLGLARQSLLDHFDAKEARILFAGTEQNVLGSRLDLMERNGGDLTLLLGRVTLIQGDRPQPSPQALSALLSGTQTQDDVD